MAHKERISVLVAGGAGVRAALVERFSTEARVEASEAATAQQALERIEAKVFDLLIVADDFPPPGAVALLQSARAAGFDGEAILLAGEEDADARGFCAAFNLPVRFHRLLECARACASGGRVSGVALGEQVFCEATQTLNGPRGPRALTEKETAILARLARAEGGVVGRDVLLREIWGYNSSIATHTLETHIHRLRRKIEKTSAQPRLLLTAPGGYRLATEADLREDL